MSAKHPLVELIHEDNAKAINDFLVLHPTLVDRFDVESSQYTPLQLAIKLRKKNAARALLSRSADPLANSTDCDGFNSLHFACLIGSMSLIDAICTKLRDIDLMTESTGTAPVKPFDLMFAHHMDKVRDQVNKRPIFLTLMTIAIQRGDLETVSKLVDANLDMNKLNSRGYASLHLCAIQNQPLIAKMLLERKVVNPDCKNANDEVPLHYCAVFNSVQVAKILLAQGADANAVTNDEGNTPFILSVDRKHMELTKLLFHTGSNINHVNKKRHTALIYAVCGRNMELTTFLVEHGADIHFSGVYPVVVEAAGGGNEEIFSYLIQQGVNVDQCSSVHGINALMNASHKGHLGIVKQLLAANCNLHHMSKYKDNALNLAAESGNNTIVQLLVEAGIDYNNVAANGNYPLMIAARDNHVEMVKLLLSLPNIRIDVRNDDCTPLLIAAFKGNWEIMKMLLYAGASVNERNRITRSIVDFLTQKNEEKLVDVLSLVMDNGFSCTKTELRSASSVARNPALLDVLLQCHVIQLNILVDMEKMRWKNLQLLVHKASNVIRYVTKLVKIQPNWNIIYEGEDKQNYFMLTESTPVCDLDNKKICLSPPSLFCRAQTSRPRSFALDVLIVTFSRAIIVP